MIQAILFDIEGTLTNLDMVKFMQNYLGILAPRFAHILSPDKFSKQLLKSMENIQKDPKPELTVMEALFEDFSKAIGQPVHTLKPIFEEFYTVDFPALRCLVQSNPQGVKIVVNANQQGFLTAIISDPLMPLKAIQEQIRWTGLNPEQFKVIATLDNLHYCKPHLQVFVEIAEKIGVRPQGCLFVSTHIDNVICKKMGVKFFFVGNTIESEIKPDYIGQLEDLSRLISQGSL